MIDNWFESSFRRMESSPHAFIYDERFLSGFSAKAYVEMLKLANVDTTCFFASSHNGHRFWPTKLAEVHPLIRQWDVLGDVLEECHRNGINVILYYSVIWDDWAWRTHPDWRIIESDGAEHVSFGGRCGVCCPNSPYRDFLVSTLEELGANYQFEGFWADMTFWPTYCYCRSCRERYAREVGGEPPPILDWRDPQWVRFQRRRDSWLAEFAGLITSTIHRLKPGACVNHQGAAFTTNWRRFGASTDLAEQNDFLNHDFYGDAFEQSFYCKLFSGLSKSPRFECIVFSAHNHFTTMGHSRLREPTTIKSAELIKAQTYMTLAHNGAMRIFDVLHPTGSLNRLAYENVGKAFLETQEYESFLGGIPCQDVAIYVNFDSGIDLGDCGINPKDLHEADEWFDAWQVCPQPAINAARTLRNEHIPYGVITKKKLADLSKYQVIILPNLIMLDEEEAAAIRRFVLGGGGLYASKCTSLMSKDGEVRKDFLLADVFGVSYRGETEERFTYIAPTEAHGGLFDEFTIEAPMGIMGSQTKVRAHAPAQVIGKLCLLQNDPVGRDLFPQIHLNYPASPTDGPAMVHTRYGKGQVVYCAGVMEGMAFDPHRRVFINIVKMLAQKRFAFEAEAPKSIEIILHHQPERNRFIINHINFQAELPNIPVHDLKARIRLDGVKLVRLASVPDGTPVPFVARDDYAEYTAPRVDTFLMLSAEYA
jgi:hypothetical protein